MRRVDMRKLYVCEIVKQSRIDTGESVDKNVQSVNLINNGWNYERDNEYGLFVKTVHGYKHVLTGAIYKLPSRETVDQRVIDPASVEEFVKAEKNLAMFFAKRNKSYGLDFIEVAYAEHRMNEEKQLEMQE